MVIADKLISKHPDELDQVLFGTNNSNRCCMLAIFGADYLSPIGAVSRKPTRDYFGQCFVANNFLRYMRTSSLLQYFT
jgi:hypothetical protein